MSIRFATGSLFRSASLPPHTGFTACGWSVLSVDTNIYANLFALQEAAGGGGNYILLATDSDGTALSIWSTPVPQVLLANLTVGTPFFWAVTSVGTGAGNTVAYYREKGTNTLTSVTINRTAGAWSSGQMWLHDDSFTQPFNGKSRNVKIWDRSLSAAELLVESFYERPMFPGSLNIWSKLDYASDTGDYSGNARSWTTAGTLTTEDMGVGLWTPPQVQFFTVPAGTVASVKNKRSSNSLGTRMGSRSI